MSRHLLSHLVLLASLLLLTGCGAFFSPIKQGTSWPFEHGSVAITVTDGELPELGSFALTQGGYYDGWAMADGTNASVDGSHVVFESDQGWELFIDRFVHTNHFPVDVHLRYEPDDGETMFEFTCTSKDLVTTEERFSGTLDCRKQPPSESPPTRVTIAFEATS